MKNRGGSADNLLNLLFPINFFFLFYENIKVKEETMYFFFSSVSRYVPPFSLFTFSFDRFFLAIITRNKL